MRPPNMPDVLPSLGEALDLDQYPLVRYIPSYVELERKPDWEESELPDYEIESWNACCEICKEDYVLPRLRNDDSPGNQEHDTLRKLPCQHAFHVSRTVCFQS